MAKTPLDVLSATGLWVNSYQTHGVVVFEGDSISHLCLIHNIRKVASWHRIDVVITPVKVFHYDNDLQEYRFGGYKENFMLNSAEYEIFPTHKC